MSYVKAFVSDCRAVDRIEPREHRNAWAASGVGSVQIQTASGKDRLGGL